MNMINDGGPAFPTYASDHRGAACNTTFEPKGGVTLRDYFAAKAMQGIISLGSNYTYTKEDMGSGTPADAIARYSYQVADAMLKARLTAAQQPAAVDGEMMERIAALLYEETTGESWTDADVDHSRFARAYYRRLAHKIAALATQHQEPTT